MASQGASYGSQDNAASYRLSFGLCKKFFHVQQNFLNINITLEKCLALASHLQLKPETVSYPKWGLSFHTIQYCF